MTYEEREKQLYKQFEDERRGKRLINRVSRYLRREMSRCSGPLYLEHLAAKKIVDRIRFQEFYK